MRDLYWPQDFRHLDIITRGESRPAFLGCDGFTEHCVTKDGVWYEIIPLPEGHPGRGQVITSRKVKPLENAELLKLLGPADEHERRVRERQHLTACVDCQSPKPLYDA